MGDGRDSDRDFLARSARRAVVGAVVLVVVFAVLYVLKAALTPLAAAFVMAYLLDPVIDRFEKRGVRRSIAIFVLLGIVGFGVIGSILVLLPKLQAEVTALARNMPVYLERLVTVVVPQIEARVGIEVPKTFDDVIARVRTGEIPLPLEATRNLLAGAVATVFGSFASLVGLLVIPVLAYYLLVDFDDYVVRLGHWIPPRQRSYVFEKIRTVDRLVSGFLRGQVLVAIVLGVLYAAGFAVIGIDLAIGVGVVSGLLAVIPYLGSLIALVSASVLCILQFGIDWHLAAVVGWYAVVQNFEGFVLTPRIVGQSVGLHPGAVIVALLIGADLFGFLGLLIAVPAAAVVKVFADELFEIYRSSSLFSNEDPTPPV
ncbi:MAG: AI-2E family transporter [Myxococcota bacterium]|jgi:predicted PurR-regulated permease PerM|nr:AI-2E family transporter [Myxococcota bacterium]